MPDQKPKKKRAGRPPKYGEKCIPLFVSVPPSLKKDLQSEARLSGKKLSEVCKTAFTKYLAAIHKRRELGL